MCVEQKTSLKAEPYIHIKVQEIKSVKIKLHNGINFQNPETGTSTLLLKVWEDAELYLITVNTFILLLLLLLINYLKLNLKEGSFHVVSKCMLHHCHRI
jgi:hypothetical protein